MKITDKTTPTGGMTEERARELLETPREVFVEVGSGMLLMSMGRGGFLWLRNAGGGTEPSLLNVDRWIRELRAGSLRHLHAELILRDFVEGEG